MAEAKEVGTSEIENLSTQMNRYPRDLLQRFTARSHRPPEFVVKTENTEEIELNLGLSLGGCFGVEPTEKRLVRSSSIAGLTTFLRDDDEAAPLPVACLTITRTCSLPAEAEEERRKRKELQCLRRMEAKRKRSEKQRNFRSGKDRTFFEGNYEEDKRAEEGGLTAINFKVKVEGGTALPNFAGSGAPPKQQQYLDGFSTPVTPSFGLPTWAPPVRGASLARGIDTSPNGKTNVLAAVALRGFPPQSSQGSLGSHGSSSSGISESESRPVQGSSNYNESRSPSSVQSLAYQSEQKPIIAPKSTTAEKSGMSTRVEVENPSKKPQVIIDNGVRETGMNVMKEMPCVSTRGDGPNGRRIEGFLYKYRKGEEVRIVCVCHGSFLSPAEFVKHAGGTDVAHPLRHIVVNTSSSFL